MSKKSFLDSKNNLIEFLEKTKVKKVILDHHIGRDIYYKEKIFDVIKVRKFLVQQNIVARRKHLHDRSIKVSIRDYLRELFKKVEKLKLQDF